MTCFEKLLPISEVEGRKGLDVINVPTPVTIIFPGHARLPQALQIGFEFGNRTAKVPDSRAPSIVTFYSRAKAVAQTSWEEVF